jgi:hypothetical protein
MNLSLNLIGQVIIVSIDTPIFLSIGGTALVLFYIIILLQARFLFMIIGIWLIY